MIACESPCMYVARTYIPLGRRFNRMETNEAECYAAINFLHNSHVYRDNRETRRAEKSKLLLNFIIITLWISIASLSLSLSFSFSLDQRRFYETYKFSNRRQDTYKTLTQPCDSFLSRFSKIMLHLYKISGVKLINKREIYDRRQKRCLVSQFTRDSVNLSLCRGKKVICFLHETLSLEEKRYKENWCVYFIRN